jgi:hypothetical protein
VFCFGKGNALKGTIETKIVVSWTFDRYTSEQSPTEYLEPPEPRDYRGMNDGPVAFPANYSQWDDARPGSKSLAFF